MVMQCVVLGCGAKYGRDKEIKFFAIQNVRQSANPFTAKKFTNRRNLWLSRINRPELNHEESLRKHNYRVCSRHFISGKPALFSDEADPDWAPSLRLGYGNSDDEGAVDPNRDMANTDGDPNLDLRDASLNVCQPSGNEDEQSEVLEEGFPQESDSSFCAEVDHNYHEDTVNASANDSVLHNVSESDGSLTKDVPVLDRPSGTNRDTSRNEESLKLQQELSELKKSYSNLRKELTERDCDKLELSNSLIDCNEICEEHNEEIALLRKELNSTLSSCSAKDQAMKRLQDQIEMFKEQIKGFEKSRWKAMQCALSLEQFKADDEMVKFYTGLSCYAIFEIVLNHVLAHAKEAPNVILAPWQCLLLTLMRLRLSLPVVDLAYRFGVDKSTVGRTFDRWLYYLYVCLKPFIIWPDRETLYATMPLPFKEAFGNSVAVIIDCFEIFIARPGALDVRAMTWSSYKHHNTVKYLIGITSCGAISFASDGWGGRTNDKEIAQKCGLYDKLLPNDVVMADRGFRIGEDLSMYYARLVIPTFTTGKPQLSAHDVTDTRKIASLRIYVEMIIGRVRRKFHILQNVLPVEFLTKKNGQKVAPIDEVVVVCCVLANLCVSKFV